MYSSSHFVCGDIACMHPCMCVPVRGVQVNINPFRPLRASMMSTYGGLLNEPKITFSTRWTAKDFSRFLVPVQVMLGTPPRNATAYFAITYYTSSQQKRGVQNMNAILSALLLEGSGITVEKIDFSTFPDLASQQLKLCNTRLLIGPTASAAAHSFFMHGGTAVLMIVPQKSSIQSPWIIDSSFGGEKAVADLLREPQTQHLYETFECACMADATCEDQASGSAFTGPVELIQFRKYQSYASAVLVCNEQSLLSRIRMLRRKLEASGV